MKYFAWLKKQFAPSANHLIKRNAWSYRNWSMIKIYSKMQSKDSMSHRSQQKSSKNWSPKSICLMIQEWLLSGSINIWKSLVLLILVNLLETMIIWVSVLGMNLFIKWNLRVILLINAWEFCYLISQSQVNLKSSIESSTVSQKSISNKMKTRMSSKIQMQCLVSHIY